MASWRGTTEDALDAENRNMTEDLSTKVGLLKGLAGDIRQDAHESNAYLMDMGDDMEGTRGLLTGSGGRLDGMMKAGRSNRKLMCYLVLGAIVIFFIIYLILSKVNK